MSEVRLIDANALEKLFEEECAGECPICGYSNEGFPCGLIKTAPTVTPDMAQVLAYESGKASADRPKGEWIMTENYTEDIICSHCREIFNGDIMLICGGETPFYCPKCGAKMKETENERLHSK